MSNPAVAKKINTRRSLNKSKYAELLAEVQPRAIRSDAENDRFTKIMLDLDEKEEGMTPEEEALSDLLTDLVEHYEEKNYPMVGATIQERIRRLLAREELTIKDLYPIFGTTSRTSEVLNGVRNPSKAQAKKLAELLGASPLMFIYE